MSLKLDGNISPNMLLLGLVAGAVVYVVYKASSAGEALTQSASDTFADNWNKAGETVPFTPMWWTNRVQDAYNAIPSQVPNAVNPASDENIIYEGVNAIVRKLPGASNDETLGTYLQGIFNK